MSSTTTLLRSLQLVFPEFWLLALGAVAVTHLAVASEFAQQFVVGQAVDSAASAEVADSDKASALTQAVGILLVVSLAASGLRAGNRWFSAALGDSVRRKAQAAFFGHFLALESGFFDAVHSSHLDRAFDKLESLYDLLGHQLVSVLRAALSTVAAIAYLAWLSPTLAVVLPSLVVVTSLVELWFEAATQRSLRRLDAIDDKVDLFLDDTFLPSNLRAMKVSSCEPARFGAYGRLLDAERRQRALHGRLRLCRRFVRDALLGGTFATAWYCGLSSVVAGELSLGTAVAVAGLVETLQTDMSDAFSSLREMSESTLGLSKAFRILDRAPRLLPGSVQPTEPEEQEHADAEPVPLLTFHDVCFRYPTRPRDPVLEGLSLELNRGQVTALCGESGCGKSTVAALLLRLYDPDAGTILLNGTDLRELDLGAFHSRVSVVSQEPAVLSGTIMDNLVLGLRKQHPRHRVVAAAKAANAHQFIRKLRHGYDTLVGEGGTQLSAGQRQRIAIARAFLADPLLLILDEATSSLDASSERTVQQALERVMRGRTALVIAHRLSTIHNAHKIVVLAHGRVAEQGTHDELLRGGGRYADLVQHQMQGVRAVPPLGAVAEDAAAAATPEPESGGGGEEQHLGLRARHVHQQ